MYLLELGIKFLKTNMMNQFVYASFLGCCSDYEGVRLYTGEGELVARILVDNGLGNIAESYSTAIKAAVPDIKSLIRPFHTPTMKNELAAPVPSSGTETLNSRIIEAPPNLAVLTSYEVSPRLSAGKFPSSNNNAVTITRIIFPSFSCQH